MSNRFASRSAAASTASSGTTPASKIFGKSWRCGSKMRRKALKERIGVSFKELIEFPQGALAIAVLGRDDPSLPAAGVLIADAGENQKKLEEVFERAGKQAEDAGAKVAKESFNSLTLHIVQPPKQGAEPRPPLVWTNAGSVFFVGSDVEIIKDLAAHRDGRDNSLGAAESFTKTLAKTDASKAQAVWYFDVAKIVKLVIKTNAKDNKAQADQTDSSGVGAGRLWSQVGRRVAVSGSGCLRQPDQDVFQRPQTGDRAAQALLVAAVTLRPESWVPATVATYQTISWDLDALYNAVDDLVNKFQPGMINMVEQTLVGPDGGQPLSFKNDVFGPLGNRISVISDYKKPIKEDSQRMLAAVCLDNAKAFQSTLSRLFQITGAAPEKREFQGTTIYDFAVNLPAGAQGNRGRGFEGPDQHGDRQGFAVRDHRHHAARASAPAGQPVAGRQHGIPDDRQGISREDQRHELRSPGRIGPACRTTWSRTERSRRRCSKGWPPGSKGVKHPTLSKLIPVEKLPDFEVFAKYLSLGGSSSVMDDDGFTMTGFTLRHANP